MTLATKRIAMVAVILTFCGAALADRQDDEFRPPDGLHEGWHARIETSLGRIVVRLFPEQSPQAVAHFVGLAEGSLPWTDLVSGERHTTPYYDGIKVHKAEAAQRFEAGDRTGTGRGAPAIYLPPEEGAGPMNFSTPYRMGMTRARGGRVSAVQFFISAAPQPWLTGRHPCFGTVVAGKDVVRAITEVRTYSNGKPIEPVVIDKIRVFTVGDPPPLAEPVAYAPKPLELQLREPDPQAP